MDDSDLPPDPEFSESVPEPERPRIPGAVKAASIILIVLGILYVLGSFLYFQAAGDEEFLADTDTSPTAWRVQGSVNIVVGIAQVLIGFQLRRGNSIARIAALVLCGLGLLLGIINLPAGILAAVLNGVVLYLLVFRTESKEFFGRPARPALE